MLAVLLTGCGKTKTAPTAKPEPDAKEQLEANSAPEKPSVADELRSSSRDLLSSWQAAQNTGDFLKYSSFYNKKHFRGVKRTSTGTVRRLGYIQWLNDRKKMFKRSLEVAAEGIEVRTWLDPGSKLKKGVTSIRFLQRWKNRKYADHGIKVINLWSPPGGKLSIIYEDLVNAEPGWSRETGSVTELKMQIPSSEAEALASWESLNITGENYDAVLASIPRNVRAPLARAFIAKGNFDCQKYTEEEECGDFYRELKPLNPKSTIADPCLRRRLAVWALNQVADSYLAENKERLTEMVEADAPTDELIAIALLSSLEVSEDFAVDVISAAEAAGHVSAATLTIGQMSSVSALKALYEESIGAAGERLSAILPNEPNAVDTLTELVEDSSLELRVRQEAFDKLAGVKEKRLVMDAMEQIGQFTSDCGLAMAALEWTAAKKKDQSVLPNHKDATIENAPRYLCLLGEGSSSYAETEAAKFFPKEGVKYTLRQEWDGEPNVEEETISSTEFLNLGLHNDAQNDEVQVEFNDGKRGKVLVKSVQKTEWIGCRC